MKADQMSLFRESRKLKFDGATFSAALDSGRLTSQLAKVYRLMRDGRWRTLGDIRGIVGGSEAGISARLRDLRKKRFGGFTVERRRRTKALWEYQMEKELC